MKIILQKSEFLEYLQPAMGTVSGKNTITSLEGVLIETKGDNCVRICTYDMKKGITCLIGAEVERPGCYIINAQRLSQICKLIPGDTITITVDENLTATISGGKSRFNCFCMKGEDFPSLPELSSDRYFTMAGSVLKDMIGRVMHAVAEQDSMTMLCGALFKVRGQQLSLVSCDRSNLAVCTTVCDIDHTEEEAAESGATEQEFSFIVPGHALSELIRILPDRDKITLYLARKHIIFKIDNLTFFARLIDEKYIDYLRIIPKITPVSLSLSRERLLEGLERANLIADEKTANNTRNYVRVILDGEELLLTSRSANGQVEDYMECVVESGEHIEIGFNCRFLINSVRACAGADAIRITMNNASTPLTVSGVDYGTDIFTVDNAEEMLRALAAKDADKGEKDKEKDNRKNPVAFLYVIQPVRMLE